MTLRETYKMLDTHQAWARSKSKRYAEAVEVALDIIDFQFPIKPTDIEDFNYVQEGMKTGKCQLCKNDVFSCDNYCSNCGQKLDWGETE